MSHLYVSPSGANWMDMDDDDDDLQMFAPDKENSDQCDDATSAVENVYNAEDEVPVYCLSLAKMKRDNGVWNRCNALPAYKELSHCEYYDYHFERVQYHSNWLGLKEYLGADLRLPMLIESSPMRLSLTWNYNIKGGCIFDEAGKLVLGPLPPSAKCEPALDTSVSKGETEEPETPPRSPPCVPGFRDEDELRDVCPYSST